MRNVTDVGTMEETLARLGVEELEERLELSPLVPTGDDTVTGDPCCGVCRCEVHIKPLLDMIDRF